MNSKTATLVMATVIIIVTLWPTPQLAHAQTLPQDTLLMALEHPIGVAADHNGNIYFTEFSSTGNGTLRRLGADGQLKTLLVNLSGPAGVAVDSKNNVYFSESTAGLVAKFEPDRGKKTVLVANLTGAWSLAVDASDNLYVSQRTVNGSIVQLSHNEFKVRNLLSGIKIPYGIYVHSNNTLYFAEFASSTEKIGAIKKLYLGTNGAASVIADLPGPYAVLIANNGAIYFTLRNGELRRIMPGTNTVETIAVTNSRVYGLASWRGSQVLFVKFGSPVGRNDGSLNLLGGSFLIKPPDTTYSEKTVIKDIADRVEPRVEEIRGLKFKHEVNVTAVYREFLHRYPGLISNDAKFWQTTQIEFEGLHFLGANDHAKSVVADFIYANLLGFYEFRSERIVTVTSEKNFQIDEVVLAHEFTHALTAQYFPAAFQDRNETSDQSSALQSILEGDARMVEQEYERRCDLGIYRCTRGISTSSSQTPTGLISLISFPYVAGYDYVSRAAKELDPRGIGYFYNNPPTSSAQIIHFLTKSEMRPQLVSSLPSPESGWRIIGNDTLGEASINSMFQNFALVPRIYNRNLLSYNSTASNGWATDTITLYSKGEETGYVWRILWNTEEDAKEFVTAYTKLLGRIGTPIDDGKWRLSDLRLLWFERQLNFVTIVSSKYPYLDEFFPSISQRSVSITNLETRNISGETVMQSRVGKTITIGVKINNTQSVQHEATIFLVTRGSNGKIVNQQILKTNLEPFQMFSVSTSWTPESADDYMIETFVVKSLQDPITESRTTFSAISVFQ